MSDLNMAACSPAGALLTPAVMQVPKNTSWLRSTLWHASDRLLRVTSTLHALGLVHAF